MDGQIKFCCSSYIEPFHFLSLFGLGAMPAFFARLLGLLSLCSTAFLRTFAISSTLAARTQCSYKLRGSLTPPHTHTP